MGQKPGVPTSTVCARVPLYEKVQIQKLAAMKYGTVDNLLRKKGVNEALMECAKLGIHPPKHLIEDAEAIAAEATAT
jgi:hypothetical protein